MFRVEGLEGLGFLQRKLKGFFGGIPTISITVFRGLHLRLWGSMWPNVSGVYGLDPNAGIIYKLLAPGS